MKVAVIGPDWSVSRTFAQAGYDIVEDYKDASILVWTGGEDINPALYGASPHPTSYWSNRDNHEVEVYQKYVGSGRLFAGICRGAQLFCAMNGGTLYQNVNNHGGGSAGHGVWYLNESGEYEYNHSVSSVHHQMCNPYGSDKKFEVWAGTRLATFRDSQFSERRPLGPDDHEDIEIMWWPESRSFGFQGHPEYSNKRCTELFFRCLDRALAYKD